MYLLRKITFKDFYISNYVLKILTYCLSSRHFFNNKPFLTFLEIEPIVDLLSPVPRYYSDE